MPLFRVVCRADSHARLMEKPGDEPAIWNLQIIADGDQLDITVGDDVRLNGDVPHHAGLLIQLERPAEDIDQAISAAINDAEVTLMMISAVARAPTGAAEPLLAYEITDSVERRPFRQWFLLSVETGKTPRRTI